MPRQRKWQVIQPPVTVSPKLAGGVIGVLLRVTAVTVTVYDPAGVDADVGMERIDEPEREGKAGKNCGVKSLGRPVTLSLTRLSSSLGTTVNLIRLDAWPPACTPTVLLLELIE